MTTISAQRVQLKSRSEYTWAKLCVNTTGACMCFCRLVALDDGNLDRNISLSPRSAERPAPVVKDLTRRQLKDLIADVYASKARTDLRCAFPPSNFVLIFSVVMCLCASHVCPVLASVGGMTCRCAIASRSDDLQTAVRAADACAYIRAT